jgi:two-component system, OmpR family, phosphate regulon sensor histidine kinase PhoR
MRSRLPLWTGLFAALFLAQLGWWGFVIWRAANDLRDAEYQSLQRSLQIAQQFVPTERSAREQEGAWQMRAADFPELAFGVETGLQISVESLRKIESQRASTQIMVLSESTLFAVLALLGFGLLTSTWKRERFLMLQQSNFLHAVTHELRSPLQSLRLAVETTQRKPERFGRYSADMLADLDRLGSLVDNLLATGRLDAEAFQAQAVAGDLALDLRTEIERVERSHQLPPGRIELVAPASLSARFDPATLEPIVRNLIDNALKYGGDQPVRVSLEQDGADALLVFEDSGRGLSANELPHVFERFWRAGDERTRTAPGAGLGLFLVKELVKAQGARIRVYSPGPEQGCRFELRWPLA